MRRLAVLLLCLAQPASAAGSELIAQVDRRLQHPTVLRGQFEQEKVLAGFSKPIASRGRFTVVKDRGVIWTTQAPFPGQLILTRDRLIQKNGSGAAQQLDAGREPALKAINTVLFALLSGDLPKVEKYFDIKGSVGARDWTLRLTPREAGWSQVISRIELKGAAHLQQLNMLDANGDATRIRFLEGVAADAPNRDEAAQLE